MKAIMSMEMIIGLLILLVVAGVVINMFLQYFNPGNLPSADEVQRYLEKAKTECNTQCAEYKTSGYDPKMAIGYCTKNFELDLDGDGTQTGAVKHGLWEVCEDAVYCFHIQPCKWETGELDIEKCRQLLCTAYREKYEDLDADDPVESSNEQILDDIEPGTCSLPEEVTDNWFEAYFGEEPCA